MTEDQHGQARGPGYVVRGDVVPEDETEEARTEESKPMTRFQKVASALRGRWGEGTNADTETLRETLRMYKTFLDQLIGPRAS